MNSKQIFQENENQINYIIIQMWNNCKNEIIANHLNGNGFKTKTGLSWTKDTVSKQADKIEGLEKKRNVKPGFKKGKGQQATGQENNKAEYKEVLPQIINNNNKLLVTSLNIAEVFSKRHDNVIRDIENLNCSKNFTALNFEESYNIDNSGKTKKIYLLTKDGLTFLVMGYTGSRAAEFKELYINKFNEMENALKNQQPKQMTEAELILQSAKLLVSLENKVNKLIEDKERYKRRFNEIERSDLIPFDKPVRAKIRQLIYAYVKITGLGYDEVWNKLYMELLYRYRVDVFRRSESRNMTKIDCVAEAGLINELFAIASEVLKIEKEDNK